MFRKASANDIDEITSLYMDVHTEEEAGRMSTGWIRSVYPTRKTVEDMVAADDLFVREANGKIVAVGRINQVQVDVYANAPWHHHAEDDEVMVLHTLVISPKAARKGYGQAFVRFYEEYAARMGCPYLRIDTNERNTRARAMYKKLGYAEIATVPCVFNGIAGVGLVLLEKKL